VSVVLVLVVVVLALLAPMRQPMVTRVATEAMVLHPLSLEHLLLAVVAAVVVVAINTPLRLVRVALVVVVLVV
jgi:hypothetical protein